MRPTASLGSSAPEESLPRGVALLYGAGMDSGAELKRLAARLQAAGVIGTEVVAG